MTPQDQDRAEILKVVETETDAYLQHDYDTWRNCWQDNEEIERIHTHVGSGVTITKGSAVFDQMKQIFSQPRAWQPLSKIQRINYKMVVRSDIAWVSYDQIGDGTCRIGDTPCQYHELKILHKDRGAWKIACLVSTQKRTNVTSSPLIEVNEDGQVLEMNLAAKDRLPDHPLLYLSANKLRARSDDASKQLCDAVEWIAKVRAKQTSSIGEASVTRAVPLGQDDAGMAYVCWALLRDGKLLITFDDSERLETQLNIAAEIYRLSETQQILARHLVEGHDVMTAAEAMEISSNTAKTHLQRIYDKIGVRAQPALVRMLLSVDRRDV